MKDEVSVKVLYGLRSQTFRHCLRRCWVLEDWRIKVSVLWLVWESAALVTPIMEQFIPGYLEETLKEVTPELLLLLAIVMLIAPIMALLSLILKDSINRWANIIVGIVFAGLGLFGASEYLAGQSAYLAFVIPIGIVEFVVAALIVWFAWKSKQKA